MAPTTRNQTRQAVASGYVAPRKAVLQSTSSLRQREDTPQFLTNDTSWVPARNSAPTPPPEFTIDLSLPPEERYVEVCNAFKKEIKGLIYLFDEVVGDALRFLPITWVYFICKLFLRRIYNEEENRELQGISKVTGVDMYLLVCFNTLLDLFMGCSSGGAVVRDDDIGTKMLHFRTLDWGMPPLRKVVVQLHYKKESNGPIIASSITYAGFVGVLTGVRKGFSESLNFRPNRNNRGTFWADVKYYWHLAMVLFGRRRSIASELRSFLLPTTIAVRAPAKLMEYSEIVQSIEGKGVHPFVSTACYLCFCNGNETTVLEKDRVTAVSRSSKKFIVITNNDLTDEDETIPETDEAEEQSPFASALQEIVFEAKDRRQCAEDNWRSMRSANAKRLGAKSVAERRRAMSLEDIVQLVQKFPTTNEMTHYACVLDPKQGTVAWCRRWTRPVGAKWIREHQSETW